MTIEYQGSVGDAEGNALTDVYAIDVLRVDGQLLAVVGGAENRLDAYTIDSDPASATYGQISATPVDTELDTASTTLNSVRAIESLEIDGTTYVFAGGKDSGLTNFTIDSAGQLTLVSSATDTSSIGIECVKDLSTVSVDDGSGGMNHLVFAVADGAGSHSIDDDGITVFQVAPDGTMTNVDNVIADGTNRLNNPQDVEAVQVDDGAGGLSTFVVAGGNQDGLSVFEVGADGALTLTDNVLDDATLSLADVRSIEGFDIDGTSYIAVGGNDGGISFFELDATGALTHAGTVADDATLNLGTIDDIYVGNYLGAPVLWVAGQDAGLDAYEIAVDGGTGAISLTRVAEFDSASYDTSDLRAIDGEGGFIVAGDKAEDSMSSFTAPCYAPGALIDTPDGPRPVEGLRAGDLVLTLDHGPQVIRWSRGGTHPLDPAQPDDAPVLIAAGALGPDLPAHDLIVSPQHRILVGGAGALGPWFSEEALVPAKSLTRLPGVRHMRGRRQVTWVHFACDQHEIVFANGCPAEALLLGPMVLGLLTEDERRQVQALYGAPCAQAALNGPPARACLTVGDARHRLLERPAPAPQPCPGTHSTRESAARL